MRNRKKQNKEEHEFYPTPIDAVELARTLLDQNKKWWEPCAGDGALIEHLETKGICMWASDIEPQAKGIHTSPYDKLGFDELVESDYVITNPPWDRKILHPMIEYFVPRIKTWLLFDADWMHTKQSVPYMGMLKKIVSILIPCLFVICYHWFFQT